MTIGELITERGAQWRIFDMGRRIEPINEAEFAKFEQGQPYFSPYLKHAWLGILSWNPSAPGEHSIWFLKLPLDERNIIQPAARDSFVRYWLKQLAHPHQDLGAAPFSYKPDAHRMAYFHALALQSLGQQPTAYYRAAQDYLSGKMALDQWPQLGLQGLAELVARLDEDHNSALLASALPELPAQPRTVLLGFLEHVAIDQTLTSAVNDSLAKAVAVPIEAPELAAFARALSQSINVTQRAELISALLQHPLRYSVELLAAIGSRSWQDLTDDLLLQYLECLARNEQGADAFNVLVADLLALPGMRARFMAALASPKRSEELAQAFARLLASVQGR